MILSLLLAGMGTAATAQNINLPIIQTKYTADPAPYVHNDTVYLYTTHDEDGAEGFLMKDWLLYTSTDSPFGPIKDPIGKPLAWEGDWFDIDPTVWVDDDNQAYMYWGNPELKAVKLN